MTKTNLPAFRLFDRNEFLAPFDRIFDNFFGANFPNLQEEFGINFFEKGSYPKVDIYNKDDCILIIAEIPGLKKDQIKVEINKGVLSISGEKHSHPIFDESKFNIITKELKYSSFKRSFKLNDILDHDSVNAKFKDGILEIKIDKLVPIKSTVKSIEIE